MVNHTGMIKPHIIKLDPFVILLAKSTSDGRAAGLPDKSSTCGR